MDPEVVALVEQHLELVTRITMSIAERTPRHVDRNDLLRAGTLGLVEAAARYDGTREVPFDRFATVRIRGAVLDAMRAADWAPRSLRSAARTLDLVEGALVGRLGRTPTVEELARESGIEVAEVHRIRAMVAVAVVDTIDRGADADDDRLVSDLLIDPRVPDPAERIERMELVHALRRAVASLPERQRRVIVGYFLEGRRSDELAAELHVTESRISQLRSLGLAELRRAIAGRDRPLGPVLRDVATDAERRDDAYAETA